MTDLNAIADDLESVLPLTERVLPGAARAKFVAAIVTLRKLAAENSTAPAHATGRKKPEPLSVHKPEQTTDTHTSRKHALR